LNLAPRLRDRPVLALNVLFSVPAAVSILQGVRNGAQRSFDFQWSGAHLFAMRVDPFLEELQHDPAHAILLRQVPNYLHELYVLLWPLGLLTAQQAAMVWVGLNLCFAVMAVMVLGRLYELGGERTVLLGLLFAMSTPFRMVLGNGQQSLLEVLLLVAAVGCAFQWTRRASDLGWLALGLSYFKYSFSPIVVCWLVLKGRGRLVLLSLIPPVVGWLFFSAWLHRSPGATALEPVMVSRIGVTAGDADLASLLPMVIAHSATVALALCLVLSGVLAYGIARRQPAPLEAFATVAVADLALLPHLTYDYVLLAVPAALLLQRGRRPGWQPAVAAIAIFILWYVFKLIPFHGGAVWAITLILVHMGLLMALGCSLLLQQPLKCGTAED
jgi:hypothetical protein